MNTRINELITRQLGTVPEESAIWEDNGSAVWDIYKICKLPNEKHNAIEFDRDLAIWLIQNETEKRELLAGLIDELYAYTDMDITDPKKYPALEVKSGILEWRERFERNVQLIEKSLSIKWSDIVIFLEGERHV